MSSHHPKIAILGAGPGGLTLASLLTKHSVPFKIFDLRQRPSSDAVNQPSGSLDLHHESGLLALQSCGLYEQFKELKFECGEEFILADKTGAVQHQDEGSGQRPEIARNTLSELLLSSVPDENILWESKVLDVQQAEDGRRWRLNLSPPPSLPSDQPKTTPIVHNEEFDLLVGADGAWSKIRPLITHVKPYFSGINCITLTIPHLTSTHPNLASLVGPGSYSACGKGISIMVQRGSLSSARIYLMISSPSSPSPETYLADSGLEQMTPEELKHELLGSPDLFGTWGEQLKELIATACDAETGNQISAKPLYMLPPGHSWSHVPGLTLIGDAAHLMTPFAGEGVNAAMLDALQLSEQIVQALSGDASADLVGLDQAMKEYEASLFPRAKEIMEETWRNQGIIFADDSPREFVAMMQSFGPPPKE